MSVERCSNINQVASNKKVSSYVYFVIESLIVSVWIQVLFMLELVLEEGARAHRAFLC